MYKSSEAGQAQAIVVWLRRYRFALRHIHDAHLPGHRGLTKGPRNTVRRVYHDFDSNPIFHTHLSTLFPLYPRSNFVFPSWQATWDRTTALHRTWSRTLTDTLRTAKQEWAAQRREHAYAAPPHSRARRAFHFAHKTFASSSLPALMKHPTDSSRLVTGTAVNDLWGSSSAAVKPNTMPFDQPKDSHSAPWLAPAIWASLRTQLTSRESEIMAPLTSSDLQTFLQHTSRSSPGLDGVQYNVLRYLCYDPHLQPLDISTLPLRFLNILLRHKKLPRSMKAALLIFILKSGDPLQYCNYRGISLLSCYFNIVIGILNGRLQRALVDTGGLDCNQGANRKGIHAAHKAAVLFNLISYARPKDEPLHIIYTDIKGAFPSVPYRAFADALQCIGLVALSLILFSKPKRTSLSQPAVLQASLHPMQRPWESMRAIVLVPPCLPSCSICFSPGFGVNILGTQPSITIGPLSHNRHKSQSMGMLTIWP